MYTIYGKKQCPYCQKAVQHVSLFESNYNYVDINLDLTARDFITSDLGFTTVPVIFHGDVLVGGYHDLLKYTADGQPDNLFDD